MNEIDSIIDELVSGKDEWSEDFANNHPDRAVWSLLSDQFRTWRDIVRVFSDLAVAASKIDWAPLLAIIKDARREGNRALLARHRRRRHK